MFWLIGRRNHTQHGNSSHLISLDSQLCLFNSKFSGLYLGSPFLCCSLENPQGVLQVVKQCVQIPVFVMIRPRGGDFLYSDREVEVMKADIRLAKLYGADGLVFGALTEDGNIDKELCMSLVAICRPLPVTFHRAFDMVHDPVAALETLLTLGFERVLTSGCDSSALEGLPLIKRLIDQVYIISFLSF
nr:copper homeostasis protein cutC homolog isoform X2 [Mirounga angustirostris]